MRVIEEILAVLAVIIIILIAGILLVSGAGVIVVLVVTGITLIIKVFVFVIELIFVYWHVIILLVLVIYIMIKITTKKETRMSDVDNIKKIHSRIIRSDGSITDYDISDETITPSDIVISCTLFIHEDINVKVTAHKIVDKKIVPLLMTDVVKYKPAIAHIHAIVAEARCLSDV